MIDVQVPSEVALALTVECEYCDAAGSTHLNRVYDEGGKIIGYVPNPCPYCEDSPVKGRVFKRGVGIEYINGVRYYTVTPALLEAEDDGAGR